MASGFIEGCSIIETRERISGKDQQRKWRIKSGVFVHLQSFVRNTIGIFTGLACIIKSVTKYIFS